MKTMKTLPRHYRKLRDDEIIHKGDYYSVGSLGLYEAVSGSIGKRPKYYPISRLAFYRRKHIATVKPVKKTPGIKAGYSVENNPLVRFFYPDSENYGNLKLRTVRLVAASSMYIVGFEVNDKGKHTFKKFLASKVSHMVFIDFNSEVI